MFKHTIPSILPLILPSIRWEVKTNDKSVYLTFDDGPHPEITPWILRLLAEYNAKATFFCVGDNVVKYPETYQKVLEANHSVGNHTFNHLSGWKYNKQQYFNNIQQCAAVVESKLFRPPYGRIAPWNIAALKKQGYQIVMWSILTRDYDKQVNIAQSIATTVSETKPGSIIVFHDSLKAAEQMKQILPEVLKQLATKGFEFKKME